MTRTRKTIKSDLRAERAKEQPDEGHLSELVAELKRAGRHRVRSKTSGEVSEKGSDLPKPFVTETKPEAIMVGNDDVSGWPPALRARVRGPRRVIY